MTKSDLDKIGLVSTDLQVFNKQTGDPVASRSEKSSFWTTSFSWDKKGKGDDLYSINTFTFKDETSATKFYDGLKKSQGGAEGYEHNQNESIKIGINKNKVTITWGLE